MATEEHVAVMMAYSAGDREAITRWRAEHPGESLELSDADLSDMDFAGADLSEASLLDANLSGTKLSGANLFGADLAGVNLFGAILEGEDLNETDLAGANFQDSVGTPQGTPRELEYVEAQRAAYRLYCQRE